MSPRFASDDLRNAGVSNTKQNRQCRLSVLSSGVILSKLKDFFVGELHGGAVFSLSVSVASSLINHVLNIIHPVPGSQVGRIAASSTVNARMQNPFVERNMAAVCKHPRQMMGFKKVLCAIVSKANLSVSSRNACGPNPAFFRTVFNYFRPEPLFETLGEYLRQNFGRYNLSLHNSVKLICATLSGEPTPRGHFYFIP